MKWRGHLAAYFAAAAIYVAWLLGRDAYALDMSGMPWFFLFVIAGILATHNGILRLSPDFDAYPIIKQLVAHRSVVFHSPLVPYILLNRLGLRDPVYISLLSGDPISAMAYGFVFGWCVHVFADVLSVRGLLWWDIPGSDTTAAHRALTGLACAAATVIFFIAYFVGWANIQAWFS